MPDKLLNVEIVTPAKVIHSGRALSVSVPGSKSPFQVLFNHAPIVSALDTGITKIVDEREKTIIFATSSGFTEVRDNKISVLVEAAFNAAKIDTAEVQAQMQDAKDKLEGASELETIQYRKIIETCANQLKAAEKLK